MSSHDPQIPLVPRRRYISQVAQATADLVQRFPSASRMIRAWADAMEWSSNATAAMDAMAYRAKTDIEVDSALARYYAAALTATTDEDRRVAQLKLANFAVWAAIMTESASQGPGRG